MKLKVIEESKDSMLFELEGEQHTFPTLLCWALLKDQRVDVAVYNLDHPLVGTPRVHLKTNRKNPRKAIEDAVKLLERELNTMDKQLQKELKKKSRKAPSKKTKKKKPKKAKKKKSRK